MSTYNTTGIVLRRTDYHDASQLFFIYTREHGKIEAVSRGSKKIKSKLRGHLEPFGMIELMIARGKRLDQIAGAVRQEYFGSIIKDLDKINLASLGMELVDRLTKPGQPDPKIFELLKNYLKAVDENSLNPAKIKDYRQHFIIKLLTLLGFKPKLEIAKDYKKLEKFLIVQLDGELKNKTGT